MSGVRCALVTLVVLLNCFSAGAAQPRAAAAGEKPDELSAAAQFYLRHNRTEEARKVIAKLRAVSPRVRLNVNIIIAREAFFRQLPLEAKKLVLPLSGNVVVKVWPEQVGVAGTKVVEACEKTEIEGQLLLEYVRRSRNASVVRSFMLRKPLVHGQRLELSLYPDRVFSSVLSKEKPQTQPKRLLITLRPIVDRDGRGAVMMLYDEPMKPEVLPVMRLSAVLPWECPGKPEAALYPPTFHVVPRYSGFDSGIHIDNSNYLLLHRIGTVAEMEFEAGVPVLSQLPLLGKAFSSRSVRKENVSLMILIQPRILSPRT